MINDAEQAHPWHLAGHSMAFLVAGQIPYLAGVTDHTSEQQIGDRKKSNELEQRGHLIR